MPIADTGCNIVHTHQQHLCGKPLHRKGVLPDAQMVAGDPSHKPGPPPKQLYFGWCLGSAIMF